MTRFLFFSAVGTATSCLITYILWYRLNEKSKLFNAYTTADEAINGMNLRNKYAVVTGSNSGIGKETAKILYKQGCNVIMACRNVNAAKIARTQILHQIKTSIGSIDIIKLDLSSLQSVRDFVAAYLKKYQKLDYLINNAGIMGMPSYTESADGFELQFAVNHIGHFYLSKLLIPTMIKNKTRLIMVSSLTAKEISFEKYAHFLKQSKDAESVALKKDYCHWNAYKISKVSNILFARELNRKYAKDGIVAVSLNPGVIRSGISQNLRLKLSDFGHIGNYLMPHFVMDNRKNVSQGAATTLRCVSMNDDEIKGGGYYHNCRFEEITGAAKIRDYKNEDSLETKLWMLTEMLIKKKGFGMDL